MIEPQDFKTIVDVVNAKTPLTDEQANTLIKTIFELDANLVILQNAVELCVLNAQEVLPAVAETVLRMSGRTDSKSKKKAAKYAGEVTARFEVAIQMYLAGAAEQAEEMLDSIRNGEYPDMTPITDTEETNEPAN